MCIFLIFVEEAVPKVHPIQLNKARHGETALLKCDASYQNENFQIIPRFNVILSWVKDGKILGNKTVDYESGNHTVSLKHSLTVNSFTDGGDYVCVSQLALKDKRDFVNDSKKVELHSKLKFLSLHVYHVDTVYHGYSTVTANSLKFKQLTIMINKYS